MIMNLIFCTKTRLHSNTGNELTSPMCCNWVSSSEKCSLVARGLTCDLTASTNPSHDTTGKLCAVFLSPGSQLRTASQNPVFWGRPYQHNNDQQLVIQLKVYK